MSGATSTFDLLSNLGKWQACSHPELANRNPEELFESSFVGSYHRLHDDLWRRITRLHGTLATLEQLSQFPFEYLYAPHEMEFWHLVGHNFYDTSILILHGLVNDPAADANSLASLKNRIIRGPWLNQKNCALLKQTYRERKFDGSVFSIAKRVDVIRDNRVAHPLVDKLSGGPKELIASVSIEELRRLFDATHSLFGAITFGSAYVTLAGDLMPCTVGGKPSRSCLDEVLDAVIRGSEFANFPERHSQWWPEMRNLWDVERLKTMNELRERIGLADA